MEYEHVKQCRCPTAPWTIPNSDEVSFDDSLDRPSVLGTSALRRSPAVCILGDLTDKHVVRSGERYMEHNGDGLTQGVKKRKSRRLGNICGATPGRPKNCTC